MDNQLIVAVRHLVDELRRESASGLISRAALIKLDHVERLLEAFAERSLAAAKNVEQHVRINPL